GGTTRNCIARLNSNGSLDSTFDPLVGFNGTVTTLAIDGTGKIYAGGNFLTYRGTSRSMIARLNTDASLDTCFAAGTGFNKHVASLVVNPTVKFYAVGMFITYNGATKRHIARLTSSGAADANFSMGTGFEAEMMTVVSDPLTGKLTVGGLAISYANSAIN